MGTLHPLPAGTPAAETPTRIVKAPVHPIESVRCALCAKKLGPRALRHHVVSPQSSEAVLTVCHTCNRAALGEGYRPAE
jgi:hypothetical protein